MRRELLFPLDPLYRAVVAARNLGYTVGWSRSQRLGWPVVSVGSISAGGAGKTPLVIRLIELFQQRGVFVDVLSRGYGRVGKETARVDPAGSSGQFGDEPLLIARKTGAPVFVGARRFVAGQLAERSHPSAGVHILDDGFQHRQLARQADIAIVTARDLEDSMLPSGNLREPFSSLARATSLAVRADEPEVAANIRARGWKQPICIFGRELCVQHQGTRLVVFCGIARPEEFFAGARSALKSEGAEVVFCRSFPDHHVFSAADLQDLVRAADESGADGFLTTEKDEIRLDSSLRAILEKRAPLNAGRLVVTIDRESEMIASLFLQLGLPPAAPFV
jgi:tetraacyldisaccharide 4'-kinase